MGRRAASVRDGVATCLWREKLGADSTAKAAWGAVWRNGVHGVPSEPANPIGGDGD